MMAQSRAHAGSSSSSASTGRRIPWIFLSHSGYQKDFTRRLNEELVHARHSPFFDEDAAFSLPKGIPYPERILESCQGCKMGIIVLSHEYMESFWPMLELQQLCKNADVLLYPLFYKLQPADFTSVENLQRWQCKWNEWQRTSLDLQKEIYDRGSKLQINIDITSWPAALKELKHRSGDVCKQDRLIFGSDDAYLKAVVSHVCSTLPPPPNYISPVDIKGVHRMQQEINKLFNEEVSGADDGITILGVHGIGGSGKSTLCLNMANYYSNEFLGRSCCLELPTALVEGESQQLLQNIKAVLPKIAQSSDNIFTLGEAMTCLKKGLFRNKVFLALDNVWDKQGVGWDTAKEIMLMNCMPGSKIMVTSRSKRELEALFRCRDTSESEQQQYIINSKIVHIPSITEDEAIQALVSYSCCSHLIPPEDLRSLARSCFFGEQCHPLYLKTIAAELRATGKASFSVQEWKKLLLGLQAQNEQGRNNEDTVMDAIKKSFERLSPQLQNIFEDLVTCMSKGCFFLHEKCKWLSFLHDGFTTEQIRNQLLKLEYHGLLEVRSEQDRRFGTRLNEIVVIHDLHKLFVDRKTLSPDAPANHFLNLDDGCSVSKEKLSKYKYICGFEACSNSKIGGQSNLEMLMLFGSSLLPQHQRLLSLKSMKALRLLELEVWTAESELTRCSGWEGAPNLVSLKLRGFAHLKDIGHLGSLLKLQELVLTNCKSLEVVNVGKLQTLRILNLSENTNLVDIYFIKKSSKLRKFLNNSFHSSSSSTVNSCEESAEWCPPNLQELDVSWCGRLKSLPNLRDAAGLTTLLAHGCRPLTEVKISARALTSLQVLRLFGSDTLYPRIRSEDCSPDDDDNDDDDDDDDARGSFTVLQLLASALCSSVEGKYGLVNLQELQLDLLHYLYPLSSSLNIKKIILLDVGGLSSLKLLHLKCFPSLQEINGLDALTNLEDLTISTCSSLRQLQLAGLGALTELCVEGCSSLQQMAGLGALSNLKELHVEGCSYLQQMEGLGALTNLYSIRISDLQLRTIDLSANTKLVCLIIECSSLEQIIGLGALTNLKELSVEGCSSLQQMAGVGALTNLLELRV